MKKRNHSQSQCINVNNYRFKNSIQRIALAHNKQNIIKDPEMTIVKQLKLENQQFNLPVYKKRETLVNLTNKQQPLNNRFLT